MGDKIERDIYSKCWANDYCKKKYIQKINNNCKNIKNNKELRKCAKKQIKVDYGCSKKYPIRANMLYCLKDNNKCFKYGNLNYITERKNPKGTRYIESQFRNFGPNCKKEDVDYIKILKGEETNTWAKNSRYSADEQLKDVKCFDKHNDYSSRANCCKKHKDNQKFFFCNTLLFYRKNLEKKCSKFKFSERSNCASYYKKKNG